jgi:hypothetical protein
MIDDCSDWMSFNAALAHVEAAQKCYEALAIRLLRKAADSLKIRSRTVEGLPRWVVSGDKYFEDDGRELQFCRDDILRLWPAQRQEAAAPVRSRFGSGAVSAAVHLALDALEPTGILDGVRGKQRVEKIREWLLAHDKAVATDLAKAVQRALKQRRNVV